MTIFTGAGSGSGAVVPDPWDSAPVVGSIAYEPTVFGLGLNPSKNLPCEGSTCPNKLLVKGEPGTLVKFPVAGSTTAAYMLVVTDWFDDPAIRYAKLSFGVKLIEAGSHRGPNDVFTRVSEPELGSILQINRSPHPLTPAYTARPKGSLPRGFVRSDATVCKDVNEPSLRLTE